MNKQAKVILWSLFVVLLMPILAYIYKFGLGLWDKPDEWSDLGGYVGGIYAPILSIVTLVVISIQIFIQHQQYQHSLIQHQEEQIKEYLTALEQALDVEVGEISSRDFLVSLCRDVSKDTIKLIPAELVMDFNKCNHRLYSMWCEVMKCLAVLENISNQNVYNKVVFASNKNKVIAYLNPQTCRMLDRFHFIFLCKCEEINVHIDTQGLKYYYSDLRNGG
ncbi:hypothetical protein CGI23_24540 [Vibrio parahaemolyticus]|uniref:hypothetical protein n=1 Tax=Vibrio parahaemolyticus TaxID=670 RepID=UPI001124BB43|nr:hypothetical protein [Vibrio parahaemolyticus]TOK18166.1 hypothetical protein CGI23_24540 [Vibrio parahaemolyticus]